MGACCQPSRVHDVASLSLSLVAAPAAAVPWDGPTAEVQAALRLFAHSPTGAADAFPPLQRLAASCFRPRDGAGPPGAGPPFSPSLVPLEGLDAGRLLAHLVQCLDLVLAPAVVVLEELRAEQEESDGTKATLPLGDAVKAVDSALKDKTHGYDSIGAPAASLATATAAGLGTLCWLAAGWATAQPEPPIPSAFTRLPPTAFHVPALNAIFATCALSVCDPSEGMDAVGDLQRRLGKFRALLAALGVGGAAPAGPDAAALFAGLPLAALGPAAKATLLYAEMVTLGQTRLVVAPVDRQQVLPSLLTALATAGVFKGPKPRPGVKGAPQFHKLFPLFKAAEGAVEGGEGHGPRKELFDLAASEALREWEPPEPVARLRASLTEGCAAVTLGPHPPDTAAVAALPPPGVRLTLRGEPGEFSATVTGTTQGGTPATAGTTLSLDAPAPFSATGLTVEVQQRATPLFRCDPTWSSRFCWLNPNVQHTLSGPGGGAGAGAEAAGDTLQRRYCGVGWLAAQAVANGVALPLPLPPAFFRFLLAPKGDFALTAAEAEEMDPTMGRTLQRVREMPKEEFRGLLDGEGLPATWTKDQWIRHTLQETFAAEGMAEAVGWLQAGFLGTGIRRSTVFQALGPHDVQAIVVGRMDDGEADFDLRAEFRVVTESDFQSFPHNRAFLDTLFAVADALGAERSPAGVSLKRLFLKFLTGRRHLPARKGEEVIRIELPYTMLTSQAYDVCMRRLPQAHTCSNTLELPNYCEGLLFGTGSWWFRNERWQRTPSGPQQVYVTDADRAAVWGQLPEEERSRVLTELCAMVKTKLVLAILNTSGYDLDERQPAGDAAAPQPGPQGRLSPTHGSSNELPPAAAGPAEGTGRSGSVTVDELPGRFKPAALADA